MAKKRKALIVDDEEQIRKLLGKVLVSRGFKIVTAEDGLEGVAQAVVERPDIILMDLDMPRMGGVAAMEALLNNENTAGIPVVVLTGKGTKENVAAARKAGAKHVIIKSDFDLNPFLEFISLLTDQKPRRKSRKRKATPPPDGRGEEVPVAGKKRKARSRSRANKSSASALSRTAVTKKIDNIMALKALPFVASEIIQVTSSPSSSAEQLTEVIERDQALTARVLQLANSAFYAILGRVQNLKHAVTRIGFRGVREMALAVKLIEEYKGEGLKGGLDRLQFWLHSLAVGVLAKELAGAAELDSEQVEDAFLAGLLHDIGRAVLDEHFHEEYARVISLAAKKGRPLHVVEIEQLGIDHAEVSLKILEKWRIPEGLTEPIKLHHHPWEEASEKAERARRLVAIVQLSDLLAKAARIGRSGNETLDPVSGSLLENIQLDPERIRAVTSQLDQQVSDLTQILLLHGDTLPETRTRKAPPETRVLLVREKPPSVDVLEFFLVRLGCKLQTCEVLPDRWPGRPSPVVIFEASSVFWLEDEMDRFEKLKGKTDGGATRPIVVADWPVPEAVSTQLRKLKGKALQYPIPLPIIEKAILS